jgi:hypothetical protein
MSANGMNPQYRFFNMTTIDMCGSATLSQLWLSSFSAAVFELQTHASRRSSHEQTLIRAFIFDTTTRELREYPIVNRVVLHGVTL